MKRLASISTTAVVILLLILSPVPVREVVRAQTSPLDLVQRVKPAVAWVISQADTGRECGSAFVVDPSGLLVTAAHVVGHAQSISVQFPTSNPMPADVVAVDVKSDLVILKVPQQLPMTLPMAQGIRVGEDAIIIGYPSCAGPDPAATKGILSGLDRIASLGGGNLIQIDAAMNPGDRGGPVLTTDGAVIGVADQEQVWANRKVPARAVNVVVPNEAVKLLVTSVTDPSKSHPPLTLPLQATVTVPLRYKGSADAGRKAVNDAACASPPRGALSVSGIHGELNARGALDIRTTLTVRTNPDESPVGDFGVIGRSGSQGVQVVDQLLPDLPPRDICLSYQAQSEMGGFLSIVPIPFEVLYKVNYRLWSPEITGEPLPEVAGDTSLETPGPPPKQAVVTWTKQPNGNQVRVTLKIIVPSTNGSARQAVKVVAIGADGQSRTIYEASHAAGETVSVSTSGASPLILQVYVGGTMAKQIEV